MYDVKINTANEVVEVKIDAGNANVLAQEADDENEAADGDHEQEGTEQEGTESD